MGSWRGGFPNKKSRGIFSGFSPPHKKAWEIFFCINFRSPPIKCISLQTRRQVHPRSSRHHLSNPTEVLYRSSASTEPRSMAPPRALGDASSAPHRRSPNGHFGPKLDAVALQRKGVRRILGFSKIFATLDFFENHPKNRKSDALGQHSSDSSQHIGPTWFRFWDRSQAAPDGPTISGPIGRHQAA